MTNDEWEALIIARAREDYRRWYAEWSARPWYVRAAERCVWTWRKLCFRLRIYP